jgi:hypothetical protein
MINFDKDKLEVTCTVNRDNVEDILMECFERKPTKELCQEILEDFYVYLMDGGGDPMDGLYDLIEEKLKAE